MFGLKSIGGLSHIAWRVTRRAPLAAGAPAVPVSTGTPCTRCKKAVEDRGVQVLCDVPGGG